MDESSSDPSQEHGESKIRLSSFVNNESARDEIEDTACTMDASNSVQGSADSNEPSLNAAITERSIPLEGLHKIQESLQQLDKSVGDLTKSIQKLSAGNIFAPPPPIPFPGAIRDTGNHKTDSKDDEDLKLESPEHIIASVRYCNWEQFKNRFNEEEGRFAIEALEVSTELGQQMKEEIKKREAKGIRVPAQSPPIPPFPLRAAPPPMPMQPDQPVPRMPNQSARPRSTPSLGPSGLPTRIADMGSFNRVHNPQLPQVVENSATWKETDSPWIERVRINSRSVMTLLGSFSDEGKHWKGEPRTFIRPFYYLFLHHENVKEKVQKLIQDSQRNKPSPADQDAHHKEETIESTSSLTPENERILQLSNKESLDELTCYVEFMDEKLVPIRNRFINPDLSKPQTVRYHEIDYLFQIGDYIYFRKDETNVIPSQKTRRITWVSASSTQCSCEWFECEHRFEWCFDAYYLDYDGDRYGARAERFILPRFQGERDIASLDFFPIRFFPDGHAELEQAKLDGAKFVDHITKKYSFYNGWSLTKGPDGIPLSNPLTLEPLKNPEHVESDVLVDQSEAFDFCPSWRPTLNHIPLLESRTDRSRCKREKVDSLSVIDWVDENRGSSSNSRSEIIVADQWIPEEKFENLLTVIPHITVKGGSEPPRGDELALLPRQMFAYAVWDRKFVPIDSRFLNPSLKRGEEDEAFDQLQISTENKMVIAALLQQHFAKKQLEKDGVNLPTQDLIRGKGRGIVILLHGLPGVGKTATAEAVAQRWKKPLFPITCGDLGFTPEKVEQSLKEIFRLAYLWDCVLLLDEADVFITRRQQGGADLQRNALVSVFLRMLEYYNGVLFLTTNRVGVLDEAIKSRVHLHLKYDRLNRDQTVEIFKHNIKRLHEIEKKRNMASSRLMIAESDILDFARKHYDQHQSNQGVGMWNGRQIRNAFLIAAALAHHEGDRDRESNSELQKQLRSSHFEKVDKATLAYDHDRMEVLQATDSEIAYERSERADDQLRRNNTFPVNHPPQQQFQPPGQHFAPYSASSNTFSGPSQTPYPVYQAPQQNFAANPQNYGGQRSEPYQYNNPPPQGYPSSSTQPGDNR